MFTKLEVRNSSGGLLTLQLGDISSGYVVQEVAGLDPVKATLTSSNFANQDGAQFQAARRETRNITMKIGLDPDSSVGTVRDLRQQLYAYFMPKSMVNLKFFVDDADDSVEDGYQTIGYVETCESAMFAQEPEMDISIICYDPDFIDPVPVVTSGLTTADASATYFPYVGSSPTGVKIEIDINRTLSEFTIYFVDANLVTWSMDVVASFLAGDVVTIDTTPGSKSATLVRSGVTSSILYAVDPTSTWYQFAPGDNWIRLYATGAAIPGTVTYTKRFGGL